METELKANAIQCFSDSHLVINQIMGEYQARGSRMAAYLDKVKVAFEKFEYYWVEQIPSQDNTTSDAVARLATSKEAEELKIVPVEFLPKLSIFEPDKINLLDERATWMTPILAYLKDGTLPMERNKARRLMY